MRPSNTPLSYPGELIHFESSDGLALAGFLRRSSPRGRSLVMHVHGMGGSFHTLPEMHGWFEGALSEGWDVLAINTRGEALEGVLKKGGGWARSGTAVESFEDSAKDLSGALRAAKGLEYTRVVLSGHSTGCQKVTYYQGLRGDPSVKGVVLLAPVDDYDAFRKDLGEGFERLRRVARDMVASGRGDTYLPRGKGVPVMTALRFFSVADLSQEEAALFDYEGGEMKRFTAIRCPVLAVFGSREENMSIGVEECLNALRAKAGSRFSGEVVPGADHDFNGRGGALSRVIGSWLRATFGHRAPRSTARRPSDGSRRSDPR